MAIVPTPQTEDGSVQEPLVRRSVSELPQTTFRTALRGFDREEVRTALEDVAADYRTLQMQNASLRRQLADLEAALVSGRREDNPAAGGTVRSRTRSTQLIERANDEAQAILTRARAEAEDIVARARTEVPAVEQLVEQLERDRRQFRSVLYSTISNLLTVLTVARRDGNGEQAPLRGRLEGKVVEAVVQPGVSEGEAAPQPSLDVERTSDIDPVEHLKAMLRGIDSTLGKIPALPRE